MVGRRKSIVFLYIYNSGQRGLGLVQFPSFPSFESPIVTPLMDVNAKLNPGEPVFAHDGTVYFAADTSSLSAALFHFPVTGGVPTPILDQYNTQVHLL